MTTYGVATPLLPAGFTCASLGGLAESRDGLPMSPKTARLGGAGPSAALKLLDVAQGYACGVPPGSWPRGARNAARPITQTGS